MWKTHNWKGSATKNHSFTAAAAGAAAAATPHHHHHCHFMALWILSRTPWVSQYQKSKTSLDLLEREIVSGIGISWAICKSAPHSRQITTSASHHSVFNRLDAHPATQPTASMHWRTKLKTLTFRIVDGTNKRGRPCRQWMTTLTTGVRLDYKSWTVCPKIAKQHKQWTPAAAGPMVPEEEEEVHK